MSPENIGNKTAEKPQDETRQEGDACIQTYKKEVSDLSKEVKNAPRTHLEKPSKQIRALSERILQKHLETNPETEKPLKGKSLVVYEQELIKKSPELWDFLIFEIGIRDFSCDVYDELLPSEKVMLLAFHGALHDTLPMLPLKNKAGKYDTKQVHKKYVSKVKHIQGTIESGFKREQIKNYGDAKKTLTQVYKFSNTEADIYILYLKQLELEYRKNNPQEAGTGTGIIIGIVIGIALSLGGRALYDRISNPRGMSETKLGVINLGDPSTLAQLVTAQQPFTITGEKTEYLYDPEKDIGVLKELINIAQNRKISMSLAGKVGVEYNLSSGAGASFIYNANTKLIEVQLPLPTFSIREKNATVLHRNSEIIEVARFDQTEQKLLNELSEKALKEVTTQHSLINLSAEQVAKLMASIYAPVLANFNHEVVGISVTIAGDATGRRDYPLEKKL